MHREWTDRLSEYIDGTLPADEVTRLEAHLTSCPACARVLDELRAVVLKARSLAAAPPARDLWPDVRAAIDPGVESGQVIDLASRIEHGSTRRRIRTVRVTVPQLVAAGLALVFASGGAAWLVRPDFADPVRVADGERPGDIPTVSVAAEDSGSEVTSGGEVAELEELLARHRDSLSPNTVRILEKNLAAIDRAIAESMQALATDPGNEFLQAHLEHARQRKLEYLREASVAFQWTT